MLPQVPKLRSIPNIQLCKSTSLQNSPVSKPPQIPISPDLHILQNPDFFAILKFARSQEIPPQLSKPTPQLRKLGQDSNTRTPRFHNYDYRFQSPSSELKNKPARIIVLMLSLELPHVWATSWLAAWSAASLIGCLVARLPV